MSKIFISHSWEDNDLSKYLAENLEKSGVSIWIDYSSLKYGDSLPKKISKALDWCDTLILLWSEHSSKSRWVSMEWEVALTMNKRIIPCIIDKTPLPSILSPYLYVSFISRYDGFQKLKKYFNDKFEPSRINEFETKEYKESLSIGKIDGFSSEYVYIGSIKWNAKEHADEIQLFLKLGNDGAYEFFNDGYGEYGYSCGVRFEKIYSNKLFKQLFYKRITDTPLAARLWGAGDITVDDEGSIVNWDQVKDTRVDNLHFDIFVKKGTDYQQIVKDLKSMLRPKQPTNE